MTNTGKEQLKREFVSQVSHLLKPNHFKGSALDKFLRSYAKRWQNEHIDSYDIIVECTKRAIDHIEKTGQRIHSPEGWYRRVGIYVLRDRVRNAVQEETKARQISLLSERAQEPLHRLEFIEQFDCLDEALSCLSEEDQRLIYMRFSKNMKYEEIKEDYLELFGEDVSVPTLRKRESRALNKLRKQFIFIYEDKYRPVR